jgi:quinol-cytochrome oxidoreductase complex cytochrome b subunit
VRERNPRLELDAAASAEPRSVRLTVVQEDSAHPLLDTTGADWLSTVPHLLLREITAFCLLVAVFAVFSYFFDAPLLDVANPTLTPNPAKAPWYFLGLQELLHYYAPLVSGILIPAVVVLALLVVPYFDINIERAPFLTGAQFARHLGFVWASGAVLLAVFFVSSQAGPVWPLIGVTALLLVAVSLPLVLDRDRGAGNWIATRSLPFWVFAWFVLSVVLLTVIGTFFRGPGWSFVLPWVSGIYE